MRIFTKTMLALFAVMIPAAAHAGPGAIINGCINFPVATVGSMTVDFTTLANHCMNSSGSNQSMPVPAGTVGVICTPIGYVEAQASTTLGNTCGSDDSYWTLSFSVLKTAYSGSAETDWPKNILGIGHNSLSLQNQSQGTIICSSASVCGSSTSITWDSGSQGPLYIIFNP